jgi:leucyl/phenylalanyl-tRNA--protein transferase
MSVDVRMAQVGGLFSEGVEPRAPLTPRERRKRREQLFEETLRDALTRQARAVARALRPDRIASLPPNLDFVLRERAIKPAGLPDPARALALPDGLCGIVADTSPDLVMEAFARGLYPKADCGPLKYWSPASRSIVRPASMKLTNATRRLLRGDDLRFGIDGDFDETIAAYAHAIKGWRSGGLLSPRALNLLASLADIGCAHAIDVEDLMGKRVAGAFGVAVGKVFVTLGVYGVDMDHADVALVVLNRHLREKGFLLHDFVGDANVERLGFAPMPRTEYLAMLAANPGFERAGRWKVDRKLCGQASPLSTSALPPPARDAEPRSDNLEMGRASMAA